MKTKNAKTEQLILSTSDMFRYVYIIYGFLHF